jgi:DNA-binding beta-propeller fold protein YncE
MKKLLAVTTIAVLAIAAEGYKVVNKIPIGGPAGWDYLLYDSSSDRIFVSHGARVEVVDAKAGKPVGAIADTPGVHGIAVAPEFNKGFISSRGKNAAIIFDLKTLQKTGEAKAGNNPDAICYEPKTKRVFAMNHSGGDATAIDAKSGDPIATFSLGPAPEFCAVDDAGKVFVNLEESNEILEIDAAKPAVTRRLKVEPDCKAPTGLAIDTKDHLLFAVCGGTKSMVIVDYSGMKVVGTAPIGSGPDAAAFDPGTGLAFSSNGASGNMTIVKKVDGKWQAVDTVETGRGARTLTLDPKTHRIYLSSADYEMTPGKDGKDARPTVKPDTFHLLVVSK